AAPTGRGGMRGIVWWVGLALFILLAAVPRRMRARAWTRGDLGAVRIAARFSAISSVVLTGFLAVSAVSPGLPHATGLLIAGLAGLAGLNTLALSSFAHQPARRKNARCDDANERPRMESPRSICESG